MNCTKCGGTTRVKYTSAGIKRRRWCEACGHRFTTLEMAIERVADDAPELRRPARKPSPPAATAVSKAVRQEKKVEARRLIQEWREMREAAAWAWDPDQDFIPEKW